MEASRPPQRVVILNGPAGVGKTTVGHLLAERVANGVCIEGDALAAFVVTRAPGAVHAGLCFQERRHVQRFLDAYTAPAPVFLFTLWAPLAVVAEREAARNGRSPLGERVAACHRAMEAGLGELGDVIEALAAPAEIAELLDRHSLARAAAGG